MEVEHFNMSNDFPWHRKTKQLKAHKNGDTHALVWVEFMCIASKSNRDGDLYITETKPYDPKSIAVVLGRQLSVINYCIRKFIDLEMLDTHNEPEGLVYHIKNFTEYQYNDALIKIRESNRERVKNYRERKKKGDVGTSENGPSRYSNVTVTLPLSRDVDVKEETKTDTSLKRSITDKDDKPPLGDSEQTEAELTFQYELTKKGFMDANDVSLKDYSKFLSNMESSDKGNTRLLMLQVIHYVTSRYSAKKVNDKFKWFKRSIIDNLEKLRSRVPYDPERDADQLTKNAALYKEGNSHG